ncbi:MAG: MXAN_6640 family putative metalloprotease [Actinomycetota bacterium]
MKKLLSVVLCLSVLALGAPGGGTGGAHASVRRAGLPQPPDRRLPPLAPSPDDALTRALDAGAVTEAEYSLDRALTLFTPPPVTRSFGYIAEPTARSATALFRDLAFRRDDLRAADRATADGLLTRPTDGSQGDPIDIKYGQATVERTCTANLCVHYATTGKHKVADLDSDDNGRPDYVDTVVSVMQAQVWTRTIEELGFRKPKSDRRSSNNGGNRKTDFYLADLGSFSVPLYGYCASDDPHLRRRSSYRFSDMSAYCVFDNDYSPDQFPNQTPLENLQVTAAHEFFHAVQFGYDIFEDLWFLENTAVWMEDEVYEDINDNLQYFWSSSMRHPHVPLDYGAGFFEYGNFIFWKYASQRFGRRFVKQVWNQADGARGEPNRYSLRATRSVIERRSAFGKSFINFAIANFAPENH